MWLVINDCGMTKGERELDRAEKSNERGDRHEIDRCRDHWEGDLLANEFDEEFWVKAKTSFFFNSLCYLFM